jgi:hypothetical protein
MALADQVKNINLWGIIKERAIQILLVMLLIVVGSIVERAYFDPRHDPFTGTEAKQMKTDFAEVTAQQRIWIIEYINNNVPPIHVEKQISRLEAAADLAVANGNLQHDEIIMLKVYLESLRVQFESIQREIERMRELIYEHKNEGNNIRHYYSPDRDADIRPSINLDNDVGAYKNGGIWNSLPFKDYTLL